MSTTVGTIDLIATIDTSQYKKGAAEIDKANANIEKSAEGTEVSGNKSMLKLAKVGLAAVAAAAVAAGAAIISSIGPAIRRVDTLNNSTRVFENMGFASDAVRQSMTALEKSITGLPTPLDSAVRGMTSLAATYGDIGQGQKIFTALNDAIIGFGGTAAEVDSAIQQLSQLPMDGPLDAQTWNSLRNSGLTPVLVALAKDMGLSINDMKEKFGSGELSVRDFTNALIKLDTEGGGGMKSLQKIAKDSTSGIGTAFDNMNTAIARGTVRIINAVGSQSIADAITNIGKAFETSLTSVAGAVKAMPVLIGNFNKFLEDSQIVIKNVAIVIGSLLLPQLVKLGVQGVRAIVLYTVSTIQAGVQSLIAGARMAAGWLLALGPIGIVVAAVAGAAALIIANWGAVNTFLESLWANIQNIFSTVGKFIGARFNEAKAVVVSVWQSITKSVSDTTTAVLGFIDQHIVAIRSVAAIIFGLLLPRMVMLGVAAVKAGVQMTIAGAQMVAAFVTTSASATANAALTTASWIRSAAQVTAAFLVRLPGIIAQFVVTSASAVANAAITSAVWIASSVTTLASWAKTTALMIASFVKMGVQATLTAARMAAAWLFAMGPLGIIIAAVGTAVGLIIANWDSLKGFVATVWESIQSGATTTWNLISGLFGGIGNWFKDRFVAVVNGVSSAFNTIRGIVGDIWNWVTGVFGSIGSVAANIIKAPVNAIIGFAQNTINGFIRSINGLLGAINNLPGPDIPKLGELNIPRLAEGAIVSSATVAMLGEGREPEAVIPLSKLDSMLKNDSNGSSSNVTVNIDMKGIMSRSKADERDIAKSLIARINEELRAKGQPAIGSGAL